MKAKEYLNRAYRLDKHIDCKMEQLMKLRSAAEHLTTMYGGEVVQRSRNTRANEDAIIRIMEAEQEINRDIDELIALKMEIGNVIRRVDNPQYQLLLEYRYLLYYSWEKIADLMELHERSIYRLHGLALSAVEKIPLIHEPCQ